MSKKNVNSIDKREGGILGSIEKIGNKLPHPIFIFIILSFLTIILSALLSSIEFEHPGTGEIQIINNLASATGLIWIMENLIENFITFRPLGMVLVMMIGLGLAEETGLLRVVLKKAIVGAPKTLVTVIVIFAGIMGNLAGSATFVVIPPLGALVFKALGRHPMAGIAAGFAGVSAGLSANLLITPTDVLSAGIVEEAAQILDPNFTVHPAVNWYFMIASTVLLVIVGTIVTEKVIEPRLGKYNEEEDGITSDSDDELMEVTPLESKGLKGAVLATLVYIVLIALMVVPSNGILRSETGTIVPSPFLSNMTSILFFWFFIISIVYGLLSKTIMKSGDVVKYMTNAMKAFSGFIVLCFFAAQFVAFFSYSNLGLLLSVNGAEVLAASGFTGIPLLLAFLVLVGFINIFIGSASAKLALLAPIFVPMFMQVGFSPYLTQAAYRISDSVINAISPLEPFMPFIIALGQRYNKRTGLGTIVSIMIPYAMSFWLAWTILLIIFFIFNIPLGPGAMVGM